MAVEDISSVPTVSGDLMRKAAVTLRGLCFGLSTSNLSADEDVDIKRNANGVWTDENELWSPEKHNLKIRGVLEIKDVSQFIGAASQRGMAEKACGVVPRGAEVGFLLQWISTCRDIKTGAFTMSGCVLPVDVQSHGKLGKLYVFEHVFDPGTIKGSLALSIHAYVKSAAQNVVDEDCMFMNEVGYVFYPPVHASKYLFQPDMPPFPIKEVAEPGKPLWWLWISDIDDPETAQFQETNVSICVNRAHPGFGSLLLKRNRATLLMVHTEIVATAYFLLVKYLKGHRESKNFWPKMMTGEGLERNTIPEVIGKFLRESEIQTEGVSDEFLHQRISTSMMKILSE